MTVLCSEGQYDNARAQLPDLCRNGKGERRGIDWGFNAWGGEVDGLYPSKWVSFRLHLRINPV